VVWFVLNRRPVHRQPDAFRVWHDERRLYAAHDLLTPNKASLPTNKYEPITIRQREEVEPTIQVIR